MDLINAQLERIKSQLAGLTITQRMLVGTLVALMAITIYSWSHYASSPEMVPVLDGSMTGVDMAAVEHALTEQNVAYTTVGGQILVPADRKMDIVANLAYSNQLPHDSSATFSAMMKDLTPFSPGDDRDMHFTQYQQQALEQMIRRFPDVADVSVIVNPKSEFRIDGSLMPSATVNIITRSAPAPSKTFHKLVDSTSGSVASAVAGLTPGHVTVVVDGRRGTGKDDSDSSVGGGDIVEIEQAYEEENERRIHDTFNEIPGLNVSVACDVENSSRLDHKIAYDPKSTVVKANEEEEKDQETHGASGSAGEPGVGANTAASIAGPGAGGGGGSEMSNTETKASSEVFAGSEDSNISTPAGKPTIKSAALRIPRSYYVECCKKGSSIEPSDAAVTQLADAEMAKVREAVTKMLQLAPEAVSVQTYTDVAPMMAMAAAPSLVGSGASGLSTVTGHAKEIGVLALAVLSLFMMSSMVRKATPAPVVIAESPRIDTGPAVLSGGEMLAGEVGASDTTLDGMELDDDAVRAQQMLDQVTTMVKDNPDSAAVLVKRWLNRS